MATTPIKYRISSVATKPTTDSVKGAPLTSLEIDGNFRSLKDSIERLDGQTFTVTATNGGSFDCQTQLTVASNIFLVLDNASTIATYTISLPTTKVFDGMEIRVFAVNQITSLTISGDATVKGAPKVMGAEANFTIKFNNSNSTWYNI